jgi:hypothetical protein
MKKVILVFCGCLICFILLVSCKAEHNITPVDNTTPKESVVNHSTPTTSIDAQSSSGFIYDESKYPLSEGLASEAFINEVGISVGGVIVEGKKYISASYSCIGWNCESLQYQYTTLGENSYPDLKNNTIPDGCPVVRYSSDLRLIIDIEATGSNYIYYSFEPLPDGSLYSKTAPPTVPGMYWLLVYVDVPNPMNNNEIVPVVGNEYIAQYKYLFAIVFD